MTVDRTSLLDALLHFSRPIEDLATALSVFAWDSDVELVALDASHLCAVLDRFVGGDVSATDVERWANAIECRDDVGVRQDSAIAGALHELANPALTRRLTLQSATQWSDALRGLLQGGAFDPEHSSDSL